MELREPSPFPAVEVISRANFEIFLQGGYNANEVRNLAFAVPLAFIDVARMSSESAACANTPPAYTRR